MHEKTLSSKTVFDGRLLKLDVLEVELESGTRTVREIVRHPGVYLTEERIALAQGFADVLRQRVNRERVDRAVAFYLRCVAEAHRVQAHVRGRHTIYIYVGRLGLRLRAFAPAMRDARRRHRSRLDTTRRGADIA